VIQIKEDKMDLLGSPIKIGRKIAPNRIVNQAMECNDADEAGNPTDFTFDRYRQLSEGGAGIIFVESLTITHESRARKNPLGIYEKTAPALERLVKEMRAFNRESLILFQIDHAGSQSGAGFSRLVSVYPMPGQEAHILSEEEIEKIGDDFARAALIAKQVGADGIDFKQCHGYLGAQILRPANTRKDRFGGPFENRTRFFQETLGKIKRAVGDGSFLLGARFSVYEGIPGGFGTAGPEESVEDLFEPLALVRLMENLGVDYIGVSGGIPRTSEILGPTKKYPEGVYRHFGWCQAMKNQAQVPIIGSGYSYLRDGKNDLKEPDPAKKSFLYWAEKNLRQGICDLVGIGRQSLADPFFAKKILREKSSEVNYCRACGGCSFLIHAQVRTGCVVHSNFYKKLFQEVQKGK
jgi:2,4-dienoyl-CoA reductase-like NADH-dependent reductase (Old Yellow Enzyme family)